MNNQATLYTVPQVAAMLGITRQAVFYRLSRGHMAGIRLGRDWFVAAAEVERWRASGPMRSPNGTRRPHKRPPKKTP